MPTITCYPLDNADTTKIDLQNGKKLLFDYADVRDGDNSFDRRIDLPKELRQDLSKDQHDYFDVVAFTHLDRDHIQGSTNFFYLRHEKKYQSEERIKIEELWVPAAVILEDSLSGEARIIQQEARFRLKAGQGIRVFSRPEKLRAWLEKQGHTLESKAHLITDAGSLIPGFDKSEDGVEFFVHSPFASRSSEGEILDRNSDALALQATFQEGQRETKLLLLSDITHEVISVMVRVTRNRNNDERLEWDIIHLPHHCSYKSLGPEKGDTKTKPVEDVAWLYEEKGNSGSVIISPSKPIPTNDEDDQPPHRQAASYYKDCVSELGGEFKVTMEHPTKTTPIPLVIKIDDFGVTVEKSAASGVKSAMSTRAPRAG